MEPAGHYLDAMRADAPLVHNITNFVSMNVMANVMLAAGASPAMVHAREEAAEFAGIAQALTVNIGTLDPPWLTAMEDAARAMTRDGKTWVLDPVAGGVTGFRRDACARLMRLSPTIIRGNASEILALAGMGSASRGADAGDSVTDAETAAAALATSTGAVVAVTGKEDFVTDGTSAYRVGNGAAIMPRVTALGCALTGVVAAFAAGRPPLPATVTALAFYGLAGERAAALAEGPGSFGMHFIDALHVMTPRVLTAGARIAAA